MIRSQACTCLQSTEQLEFRIEHHGFGACASASAALDASWSDAAVTGEGQSSVGVDGRTLPGGARVAPWLLVLAGISLACALFWFGQSAPLGRRLRGDAFEYMKIAARFDSVETALHYAGARSAGMPLLQFFVRRALIIGTDHVALTAWADATCRLLLLLHLAVAALFAHAALRMRWLRSRLACALLLFLLASCPALVGHTATPLTDTLAVDFVLLAVVSWGTSNQSSAAWRSCGHALCAGGCLAASILLRPAYLLGVVALLGAGSCAWVAAHRRRSYLPALTALACAAALYPFATHCAQRYGGGLCLQAEATFDPVRHAQAGLLGGRVLWEVPNATTDVVPVLPDAFMVSHFHEACRLTSIAGSSDSSLIGCLLRRPLAMPVYVVKKWIGLFDHFRFTPYLEQRTPAWLCWLSRGYDLLFWLGLLLGPAWILSRGARAARLRTALGRDVALLSLCAFSLVMLAEHTVLHAEDRFSLPLLPLCALSLVAYLERSIARARAHAPGLRPLYALAIYLLAGATLYGWQILAWDAQVPLGRLPLASAYSSAAEPFASARRIATHDLGVEREREQAPAQVGQQQARSHGVDAPRVRDRAAGRGEHQAQVQQGQPRPVGTKEQR